MIMTTTTLSLKLPNRSRSALVETAFPELKKMNKEYSKRKHSCCCEWKSKIQPSVNPRRAKSVVTSEDNTKAKRIVQKREKLFAKMERKEQLRLERLKYAAENGKIKITTNGLFETKACKECDKHHKIASIKIEKSQRNNCFRPSILSRSPSPDLKYKSEGQLQNRELFEMSFEDPATSSPMISFRDSDVCGTSSELEVLETEKLQTQYYQEMLNQEETALRARVQYENKLLDKAKKKHRYLQIQQVQQELAEKKRVDQTKLRLEALIKQRIALEAINDTLNLEQEKQRQLGTCRSLEEENRQEKLNIQEKVQSSIAEQLPNVYRKTPYPCFHKYGSSCSSDFSLKKPLSSTGSSKASAQKSVQINDEVSIITGSSIGTSCLCLIDVCDSSRESGLLTDAKTRSNTSCVKGVIRTNSLRHLFDPSITSIKESTTEDEEESTDNIKSILVIPVREKDEITIATEDQSSSMSSNKITQDQPLTVSGQMDEIAKTTENQPNILDEDMEDQSTSENDESTQVTEEQSNIVSSDKKQTSQVEIIKATDDVSEKQTSEMQQNISESVEVKVIDDLSDTTAVKSSITMNVKSFCVEVSDLSTANISSQIESNVMENHANTASFVEVKNGKPISVNEMEEGILLDKDTEQPSECAVLDKQAVETVTIESSDSMTIEKEPSTETDKYSSECSKADHENTNECNSELEVSQKTTDPFEQEEQDSIREDEAAKDKDSNLVETLVNSCKKVYNEEESTECSDVLTSDVVDEQSIAVVIANELVPKLVNDAIEGHVVENTSVESRLPSFAEQLHSALLSATLSINPKPSKDEVNKPSTEFCETNENNKTNEMIIQELQKEADLEMVPENEIQITESVLNTTAKAIVCNTISKAGKSLEQEMQQEITEISKNLVHEALKNALTGSECNTQKLISVIQ